MYNSQLILESLFVDYNDDTYDDTLFKIKANNENCAVSLEFYGTPEEFADFGAELMNFPKNITHEVHYPPRDSYDKNVSYAYWLTIKVFCYDPSGHAVIEIMIDNNYSMPNRYRANFCVQTDDASLNKLGHKLVNWNVRNTANISLYDDE